MRLLKRCVFRILKVLFAYALFCIVFEWFHHKNNFNNIFSINEPDFDFSKYPGRMPWFIKNGDIRPTKDDHSDGLLLPEESDGDRIVKQLMYYPTDDDEDGSDSHHLQLV